MPLVLYKKQEHIAYITLNRPESLNTFRPMAKEINKIWVDFRCDNDLWVAILNGEVRSFSVGVDVKEMERGKWQFRQSLILGDDFIRPFAYQVWKPIIAAVHGHVFGMSLMLALDCDIRIAVDDALFGIPEAKVNVPVLFAPFLPHYLPRGVAAELLLTGNPIDAQRACQLGLVTKVVPGDQLISTATTIVEGICDNGPLASRATKEIFYRSCDMDYASAIALTEHIATPIFNSEDSIEAKRAFNEKRKPQWKLK